MQQGFVIFYFCPRSLLSIDTVLGTAIDAYALFKTKGAVDETCTNYQAKPQACTPEWICRNCAPNTGCSAVTSYPIYKVLGTGTVSGVTNMQNEIYTNGPIACAMNTNAA